MVSVEFDSFSFVVKDLATGNIVHRFNSTGDLYPFQLTHGATIPSSTSSGFFLSPSIWHSRLGHAGNAILNSLYSSDLIKCNKTSSFVCHSSPLEKHVVNCHFISIRPFEIIHSDIWTSLIIVLRTTNTTFFFLITILISCGLSHYFVNLKFMKYL